MSETTFSNDEPVSDPWQEDRLGFASFSKRLSNIIISSFTDSGFVIGLSGPWGSGKTTAINFTKSYIQNPQTSSTSDGSAIHIIDFEPWLISGKVDLISAFFQVLAEHFPDKPARRIGKRAGLFLGANTDTLASLIATVGATVDPTAGLLSNAVTRIGKNSLDSSISRWLQQPSLQSSYTKLVMRLLKEKKKILIVIDDIDRLEPDEIRAMMQMVKSVGKLPYVTYLLSYDRKHVAAAVRSGDTAHGEPSYLEKIIQQELTLPHPDRSRLLAMLDTEINFISKHADDNDRWYEIVTSGIYRWVRRPRDINRLANSLKFSWPILQGEIDPVDLIAMEGIRLFDPAIFDWLIKNQEFLFPTGRYLFNEDEQKRTAEALQNHASEHSNQHVLRLLATLFPSKGELLSGDRHVSAEPHYRVVRRLGVGSQTVFQSYMQLFVSDTSVTGEDIRAIIGNLNNPDELTRALKVLIEKRSASGAPLMSDAIEQLRYHLMRPSPVKPTQFLLNSLFAVGPEVVRLKDEGGFFSFGASTGLFFLIIDILEKLQTSSKVDALIQAVKASGSTSYGIQNFYDLGVLLGRFGDYEGKTESPISENDLGAYAAALRPRFEEDIRLNAHLNYPAVSPAIRLYEHLYGKEKCSIWVTSLAAKDQRFLIGVCEALLTTSTGSMGTRYLIKNKPDTDIYDLPALLPLAEAALADGDFDNKTAEKLKAVIRDIKAGLAAHSDQSNAALTRSPT